MAEYATFLLTTGKNKEQFKRLIQNAVIAAFKSGKANRSLHSDEFRIVDVKSMKPKYESKLDINKANLMLEVKFHDDTQMPLIKQVVSGYADNIMVTRPYKYK